MTPDKQRILNWLMQADELLYDAAEGIDGIKVNSENLADLVRVSTGLANVDTLLAKIIEDDYWN